MSADISNSHRCSRAVYQKYRALQMQDNSCERGNV
jgi:hypothetical protein